MESKQINISLEVTDKQDEALKILDDKTTTEIFYGGGAGGGKSFLGCVWILQGCIRYKGSRWLMGRAILKTLKESTLLTFFEVCRRFNLRKDEHYTYNSIEGIIRFKSGSEIHLRDLFAYPSDPEFDELGSTEYTGAFIDEGSQITAKAKSIVMSRIRYKLEEFNLIPKLLIASNPSKNFLYYEFYKPAKEGTLPLYRQFIRALVTDNPFISPHYVENLKKLDKATKERLLFGNFEYDDDPARLFDYDAVIDIFSNRAPVEGEGYLTVDVARFGKDNSVFFRWKNLYIAEVQSHHGLGVNETARIIEEIRGAHKINRSHVAVDEDGVGGGVVDILPGVKGFTNNGKAINPHEGDPNKPAPNYANLKSQCYFYLADAIKNGQVGCYRQIKDEHKSFIIEDLEQIKQKDADKDGRLCVIGKDEIKEKLGRSPDFGDAMMMRMIFAFSRTKTVSMVGWTEERASPAQKQDAEFLDFLYG